MNMKSMSVNPAQVRALSETIKTKSNQIKGDLEALEKRVNELKSSWEGESTTAYAAAQAAWDKQINEMEQLLGRIGAKLIEIADGYEAKDAHSAKRFG
jgi:WXG100 family type VII secretion target